MSQSHTRVWNGLLHPHAKTADGTRTRRFGNGDGNIIQTVRLLAIPVVEGMDFHSQRLECRQRERTVFFRS